MREKILSCALFYYAGGMIIREPELLKDVSSLDAESPGQISDMVYDLIGTTPGSFPEGI